jgi:hypothetical protein
MAPIGDVVGTQGLRIWSYRWRGAQMATSFDDNARTVAEHTGQHHLPRRVVQAVDDA